jgi:hypothetical protein
MIAVDFTRLPWNDVFRTRRRIYPKWVIIYLDPADEGHSPYLIKAKYFGPGSTNSLCLAPLQLMDPICIPVARIHNGVADSMMTIWRLNKPLYDKYLWMLLDPQARCQNGIDDFFSAAVFDYIQELPIHLAHCQFVMGEWRYWYERKKRHLKMLVFMDALNETYDQLSVIISIIY